MSGTDEQWPEERLQRVGRQHKKELTRIADQDARYRGMIRMIQSRDKMTCKPRDLTGGESSFLARMLDRRSACYGECGAFDLGERDKIDALWNELMTTAP